MFEPGWITAGILVLTNVAAAGVAYGLLISNGKRNEERIKELERKSHESPCMSIAEIHGELKVIRNDVAWIKKEIENNGFCNNNGK